MTGAPEVSHGRGGAGNINPDDTKYVDGEIVRLGQVGSHGDGAFSTGRGGAANIADVSTPASPTRADREVIPAEATRVSQDGDYHVGRGGAANIHLAAEHQKSPQEAKEAAAAATSTATTAPTTASNAPSNQGLADKLKHKIFSVFRK
ncbi:hypothetical protein GGS23DRAFT_593816 [Durotheca rogersii]|uniref:uncharacterized protein n=1 Tax=Durotheca rogersii TaxID=419775 RepID=UPI002220C797|nr:uncharacterized protein GGS23DRAFT_593816 [Durotheca rogersii]KAI5867085.1 hypothetical protein GGS23DRAFT_593816 [Durotheca rogersii]